MESGNIGKAAGPQRLALTSNGGNEKPPSGDKLSASCEEIGAIVLVGSNLADTLGTLLEAFHAQGLTNAASSIFTPGVVLVMIGGGSGIVGLAIFIAGHLRSSDTLTLPASAQQESCHYFTKENLSKFAQYGAFYSCALGGLLDTGGTLAQVITKQPGVGALIGQMGKGLLIGSSTLNAAGFLLVLCEGAILLSGISSGCPEPADLGPAIVDELTSLRTTEPIVPTDPPEEVVNKAALPTNWDIKALGFLGGALVTFGGFLDPVGTLTTNFNGTQDNSTQTEQSAGLFVLTTACVTTILGLGTLVLAFGIGKYRSTSTASNAISNPSPVESPDNPEEESAGLFSGWPAASELHQLALQAGYPY